MLKQKWLDFTLAAVPAMLGPGRNSKIPFQLLLFFIQQKKKNLRTLVTTKKMKNLIMKVTTKKMKNLIMKRGKLKQCVKIG